MDLLPAQTIPGSNMEWLKSILVVAGKRRVAQPPLGVELEGVFELMAVVHGPVVDRDDGLVALSVYVQELDQGRRTYTLGNIIPTDRGTSLWRHPRQTHGNRRVHSECLVQARKQIRQRADADKVNLVLGLEGGPDLSRQFVQGEFVRQQEKRDAREKCRRGLGPANDENAAVGLEAVESESLLSFISIAATHKQGRMLLATHPLLLLLQQPFHQVRSLLTALHSPPQLRLGHLHVLHPLLHHLFRRQSQQQLHQNRIVRRRLKHRPRPGHLKDGLDPRMILAILQAPKAAPISASTLKTTQKRQTHLSPNAKSPITSNVA